MAQHGTPIWLAPGAAAAMRQAFIRAALQGDDGLGAAQSVALAWHPALPLPMIAEAVTALLRESASAP